MEGPQLASRRNFSHFASQRNFAGPKRVEPARKTAWTNAGNDNDPQPPKQQDSAQDRTRRRTLMPHDIAKRMRLFADIIPLDATSQTIPDVVS